LLSKATPARKAMISALCRDRRSTSSAGAGAEAWRKRRWNGSTAYAESKLHDATLAFAIARRWSDVLSNALEPGWVPTKMGGTGAPDDMDQAHLTQAWLAAGDDPKAQITGNYFYHLKRKTPDPEANDAAVQERLIDICAKISGVVLPA
jgi:NAD(P)-dependent dehydrogenase (short-subunit alcohol dehydrogenase family)